MNFSEMQSRDDIGHVLDSMGLTGAGAEVGVAFGDNAEQILLNSSLRSLVLIDPWNYVPGESPKGHGDMIKDWEGCYLSCVERMKPFDERLLLLRKDSESASQMFEDGSFDFVYIDANHMSPWIDRDLSLWWPKVKSGGVFGGHDYHDYEIDIFTCNVKSVVDAFFADLDLGLHVVPGEVPSFYVVKP